MNGSGDGSGPGAKKGVDIYNPDLSVQDIFGDLNGGNLLDAIFNTYQVGQKQRIQFFLDTNTPDSVNAPFASRMQGIIRHGCNQRTHAGVKRAYVKSCQARGICEGVRGECWVQEPSRSTKSCSTGSPYRALSYGSLLEAFYAALHQEPGNSNLLRTLQRGIEVRIFDSRMPDSISKYLVKLHNRFHGGAGTSFVELMASVPDVAGLS